MQKKKINKMAFADPHLRDQYAIWTWEVIRKQSKVNWEHDCRSACNFHFPQQITLFPWKGNIFANRAFTPICLTKQFSVWQKYVPWWLYNWLPYFVDYTVLSMITWRFYWMRLKLGSHALQEVSQSFIGMQRHHQLSDIHHRPLFAITALEAS